ncbi:DnaJ domain protein [Ostertagia ostertagi]
MKLEARFNSDSRFKLDEKFVSSGSEDEDEDEVVQERSKQLEVLSRVLGSTVKPQKKTLKSSEKDAKGHAKVRPFTRFDPFNEEHVRWLKKEEELRNGANDEDSNDEHVVLNESEGGPIKNGIHYEMQPDFAEELKVRLAGEASAAESSNANGGFSFLAMKMKMILESVQDDDGVDTKVVVPVNPKSSSLQLQSEPQPLSGYVRCAAAKPTETSSQKNYKHLRKAALKENRQNLMQSNGKNKDKKGLTFPKKRDSQFMDEILSGQSRKVPEFYQTLGCDRNSSLEQITAEYRARVKYLHPDKLDEADPIKHEEYLRLQSAYDTLSDEEERRCYDAWLDCLLPLSYEEFKRNKDALKVKETPMISSSNAAVQVTSTEPDKKFSRWESERLWCGQYCRGFMNAYSLDGLVIVALLVICSCAYLKRVPRINSWLLSEKKGFFGVFYKASVIGVRLHSFVSAACFLAAGYTLFIR